MRRLPEPGRDARPESNLPDLGMLAQHQAASDEYVQIRTYLRIAYRRRWILAGFLAAGVLIGQYLNSREVPMYEAWTTLQIEADPNILGLDRPLVEQRDWMREFLPTQLAILRSRELASMAREELANSEVFEPDAPEGTGEQPAEGTPADSKKPLPSVGAIAGGRMIGEVRNTRLVNIGYRSTDPVQAAEVANALARAYVRWNFEFKFSTTGEASEWLAQQVEEQRKAVQASEAALQRYREQHGAEALRTLPTVGSVVAQDRQNIVVQKLAELQAAVTMARTQTIDREARYRQLAALQASGEPLDTFPAIGSNSFIQALKGEVANAQHQLAQASEKLGELHPEIIRLKGAVQEAERKLQTEISKAAAAIRNDFETARANEQGLIAALDRQKIEVSDLNAKAVEYTALEGEARANRQLLDNLVQRSRQIALARDIPSANARILDAAEVPWEPVSRMERTMSISLVGSGVLAFGLIFMLELFNNGMRTPEEVERNLRIPLLGVTPQVKGKNGHVSLLLNNGASPRFKELLHGVRTNLVMAPALSDARTVLVTSSEPGEGKTVAAANLAISLARLNQRVLLVDGDLRKPQLHSIFGVEQQPGLTDVLTGRTTQSVLSKTSVAGLWLMPAGVAARNPADLLGSDRFGKLMECLEGQFDWIVLDSPPVLAVTDPCLIARVASGVLFVVGSGQTSRDVARAAVERLDSVGATILGALLNRAALDQPGDSYLPYYHREYETYYPRQEGSWVPALPGSAKADGTPRARPDTTL